MPARATAALAPAVLSGAVLAAVGAMVSACWEVTRPSLPVMHEPAVPPVAVALPAPSATAEVDESPTAEAFAPPPPLQLGPQVQITEVVGVSPGVIGAILAPAMERLEKCGTRTRSKLVLRVVSERERTHLRVVDPGQVDNEANHCVLEALSTADFDQAVQPSASPSDKDVSHVETQLVISW